uniref:Uncharacterized protein n=1 Tax=Arundo donax TaxID=35708 RepID=A0A0A8ZL86_ARUDO
MLKFGTLDSDDNNNNEHRQDTKVLLDCGFSDVVTSTLVHET